MPDRFSQLIRYIGERRAEITGELELLEDIDTPRVQARNAAMSNTAAAAEISASRMTSSADIKGKLLADVTTRLTNSISAGVGDNSEAAKSNRVKQFLNETLVLTGLSLKTDPGFGEGMLGSLVESLTQTCVAVNRYVADGIDALDRLVLEAVGQGRVLSPTDPSLDVARSFLVNARDSSDKLLANLGTGFTGLAAELVQAVRVDLQQAGDTLHQGEDRLDVVKAILRGLRATVNDLTTTLTTQTTQKKNIVTFQTDFERSLSSTNTDRTQITAVLNGAELLIGQMDEARGRGGNMTEYREGWTQTIAALVGIAALSDPAPVKELFQTRETKADYDTLAAGVNGIPDSTMGLLRSRLDFVERLYLGTVRSETVTSETRTLINLIKAELVAFRDRGAALMGLMEQSGFVTATSVARVRAMMESSQLTEGTEALKNGDVAGFFGLTQGNLTLSDKIAKELQDFRSSLLPGASTNMAVTLSQLYQNEILGRGMDDVTADQDFESSRTSAIDEINRELRQLAFIESLLDQAEAT